METDTRPSSEEVASINKAFDALIKASEDFMKEFTNSSEEEDLRTPSKFTTMSLGSEMTHTLSKIHGFPLTKDAAMALKWGTDGKCIPGLGVRWQPNQGLSSKNAPLGAYYTPYGQLAGL